MLPSFYQSDDPNISNDPEFIRFYKILTKINSEYNYSYDSIKYVDLVKQYFNSSDAYNFIKILSTCTCCSRHQQNRPNTLELNYKCSQPSCTDKNACQCQCRHIIRWLNRAYSSCSD